MFEETYAANHGQYAGMQAKAANQPQGMPHMSRMQDTLREAHGRIAELDKILSTLSSRLFGPEPETVSGASSLSQVPNGAADEVAQLADGLNGALAGLHGRVLRLEQRL